MAPRRPIIGGNWKMNTDRASAEALAAAVARAAADLNAPASTPDKFETIIFPPFVYLQSVRAALDAAHAGTPGAQRPLVALGAQDCYHAEKGAFTGEISCAMLRDVGCSWVLTGHSERRHILHEGDDLVDMKTVAALSAGLGVVLCVGEKLEQRQTGQTDTVNERQVRQALRHVRPEHLPRLVIAYEPVWAIGTGRTATPDDAQSAHAHIRAVFADLFGPAAAAALRIQYGGSVTAANAADLLAMPDVDGALVGGASLKDAEFAAILRAAANAKPNTPPRT
jgi:triosephosphate isomerase